MASITFDTLKFVERLRAAGVPEDQAKAMAEAQRDIFAEVMDSLATKADIFTLRQDTTGLRSELKQDMASLRSDMASLRSELKQDMASLRSELKQDMASLRSELKQEMADLKAEVKILKWMMGILLGGVVALILKAFFPM